MNHSVTHKDAAEPQKIDGQNAVIVEKKKELTKRTTFVRVTQQLNEVFGKS